MNAAWNGFSLVSLSFHILAFAPKLDKYSTCANIILVGSTIVLLITISFMAAMLYSITVFCLLLVFPMWLHSLQHLLQKEGIRSSTQLFLNANFSFLDKTGGEGEAAVQFLLTQHI